jgi:hypothetical protein
MLIDVVGYLAAGLVLVTFCTRSMSRLRLIALASNVAFITYGYLANLTPVLALHTILLPVNTYRLGQLYWSGLPTKLRERKAGRAPAVTGDPPDGGMTRQGPALSVPNTSR